MNINDVEPVDADGELLEQIFYRQLELIHKYHDIEAQSGIFNYQDGNIPVNLHTLSGQVRLKDFAWRAMEEVAEALDGGSTAHKQEEIADALHFLVEMYIIAGYTSTFFGTLEDLYSEANRTMSGTVSERMANAVTGFVFGLGNTMNRLKNKPWKQSQMLTDIPEFEAWLKLSFFYYIQVALSFGIETPQQLFDLYFRKSEVNKFRQRSGY